MGREAEAGVIVREMRPDDLDRVRAITLEGFGGVSVEAAIDRQWPGKLPTVWGERKWRAMQAEVRDHPECCFVAEVDGEVAGYITTIVFAADKVGRIPDLAVDARFQGRGIGRQLLERAIEFFRGRGLMVARIETLANNEVGNHLYPSVGFEEVARQVHFAMRLDGTAPKAHSNAPSGSSEHQPR
jgi:ribosomal protein S18 acetylase RimI-like enzyme